LGGKKVREGIFRLGGVLGGFLPNRKGAEGNKRGRTGKIETKERWGSACDDKKGLPKHWRKRRSGRASSSQEEGFPGERGIGRL